MNLKILLPFKLRNPHIRALVHDYAERVQRYRPLKIVEEFQGKKDRRAPYLILLSPQGRQVSTEEFCARLREFETSLRLKALAFGIGDAEGRFPGKPEEQWSCGSWIHPHELMVLILAEQLYRVLALLHNHPYPK